MTQEAVSQFYSVEQLSKELNQLWNKRTVGLPLVIEVFFDSPQVAVKQVDDRISVVIKGELREGASIPFIKKVSGADKIEQLEGNTILIWRVRCSTDDAYDWLLNENAYELIEQLNEAVRERSVVIAGKFFTDTPQREALIDSVRADLAYSLYDLLSLTDLGVN